MSKRKFYFDAKWISLVFFLVLVLALLVNELIKSPIDHSPEVTFTSKEQMELRFVNVGQGDCTILRTPSGKGILIDVGPEEKETEILNSISAMGIKEIEYLILTHPHSDHVSSVDKIIDAVKVNNIIHSDHDYSKILQKASEKNILIEFCQKNKPIEIDGVDIVFLTNGSEIPKDENGCIVTGIRYKETSFLLSSDSSEDYENYLIKNKLSFDCDVLKVSHHGSSASSSEEFLNAFKPEIAVISVGENNSFGHPSKTVLERLEKTCGLILRTDLNGNIRIRSDGNNIKAFSEK